MNKNNFIIFGFILLFSWGCVSYEPHVFASSYDPVPEEYFAQYEDGNSSYSVIGSGFLRQVDGGTVDCGGNTVTARPVMPTSQYSSEYNNLSYGVQNLTLLDPQFEADRSRLNAISKGSFCDVDGNFPNHHPDPSNPKNLLDLKNALQKGDSELGLAFDGDADRLGVVTKDGEIIFPDRQLLLFSEAVLKVCPQTSIIFDVKSTRYLFSWIKERGGVPVIWKTGHSFIKQKMKEINASLAGEMSGHTFFNDRWYGFDDGLYAAARLLEILSEFDDPSKILKALPKGFSTPELNIKLKEGEQHKLINELQETALFPDATDVIKIDGLRVEYREGFGLMRASNTTPAIVLRFEADTEKKLKEIQDEFKSILTKHISSEKIPF